MLICLNILLKYFLQLVEKAAASKIWMPSAKQLINVKLKGFFCFFKDTDYTQGVKNLLGMFLKTKRIHFVPV